jgi:hypothetical protein
MDDIERIAAPKPFPSSMGDVVRSRKVSRPISLPSDDPAAACGDGHVSTRAVAREVTHRDQTRFIASLDGALC